MGIASRDVLDTAVSPRHCHRMITLALTLALAGPAPVQAADPLAPAREGRLQCHSPDTARKTCAALAGYTFASDGTILNQSEVMVNPSPLIVMRDSEPVYIRDGAVCGRVGGFEDTVFLINGHPTEAATANMLRQRVVAAFDGFGTEVCTTYVTEGDALRAEVAVDGQRRTELDQSLIWVSPADGYSVRP